MIDSFRLLCNLYDYLSRKTRRNLSSEGRHERKSFKPFVLPRALRGNP